MNSFILAIDPGNKQSGFAVLNTETYLPIQVGKVDNEELLRMINEDGFMRQKWTFDNVVIEMIASYGMPVGAEVFDTCVWIGRFYEAVHRSWPTSRTPAFIYRKQEKMNICGSPHANDATIKQALVDRFAYGVPNHGKGNKKEQGWFYGFKADMWAAYAVGVTYLDLHKGEEVEDTRP